MKPISRCTHCELIRIPLRSNQASPADNGVVGPDPVGLLEPGASGPLSLAGRPRNSDAMVVGL